MNDEPIYICPETGKECEYGLPCVMLHCAVNFNVTAEVKIVDDDQDAPIGLNIKEQRQ